MWTRKYGFTVHGVGWLKIGMCEHMFISLAQNVQILVLEYLIICMLPFGHECDRDQAINAILGWSVAHVAYANYTEDTRQI